jgi:hypothetical protein
MPGGQTWTPIGGQHWTPIDSVNPQSLDSPLGHASLRTTERHYVAANTRSALRRHHDRIREIRLGTGPGPGRAGGA